MKILLISILAVLSTAAAEAATIDQARASAQALSQTDSGAIMQVGNSFAVFAPVPAAEIKVGDTILYRGTGHGAGTVARRMIIAKVTSLSAKGPMVQLDVEGPQPYFEIVSPADVMGRLDQSFPYTQ